ncbi:unnamed protein product (macronuclear) [Paramecium tetraurelia]|uniref:Uncharacterized protein n=1 Tax=Paramecium tetraurelia TaxID=5888 RepID=A0BNP6_PARTE|nr:uncharacterized protein GSPATT00030802001 [Paramecium tetraurelia]CAK60163.1 unnamed protein product [Paramecium tetraurelia]|eukprot:XP_001427561.1 hypothetical protein (macronuclear) [Paramecium tetraurelia strain d4-2]
MAAEGSLEWKYMPVTGVLVDQKSNKVIWELKSEDSQWPKDLFTVSISQSKEFMSDPELGWNWHKSWNLPDINYTLNFKKDDTTMRDFRGGILEVQIFVIKRGLITNQYISLGLRGNTKLALFEPSITFSGLKFATTSYNNKYSKFNFIFVLSYSRKEEVLILDSQISSDVFVDSRNRTGHNSRDISQEMFLDLFPPQFIDQIFYKRENAKQNSKFSQIDKSLQGFINYYTSPNIRNKIKHPLFMVMKFPKCVKLFFGANFIKKSESVLMQVLSHLSQVKQQLSQSNEMKLLIKVENSNQNTLKKALDIIKQLENNYYEIYTQRANIPSDAVEITDIYSLTREYKRKYQHFIDHAEGKKQNENFNGSKPQNAKLKQTQKGLDQVVFQDDPKQHLIQVTADRMQPLSGQIRQISKKIQLNHQQHSQENQGNQAEQVKDEKEQENHAQNLLEKQVVQKDKIMKQGAAMNPNLSNNQFQAPEIFNQFSNLQYCNAYQQDYNQFLQCYHSNQQYGNFNLMYPYYYHQYQPKE